MTNTFTNEKLPVYHLSFTNDSDFYTRMVGFLDYVTAKTGEWNSSRSLSRRDIGGKGNTTGCGRWVYYG